MGRKNNRLKIRGMQTSIIVIRGAYRPRAAPRTGPRVVSPGVKWPLPARRMARSHGPDAAGVLLGPVEPAAPRPLRPGVHLRGRAADSPHPTGTEVTASG